MGPGQLSVQGAARPDRGGPAHAGLRLHRRCRTGPEAGPDADGTAGLHRRGTWVTSALPWSARWRFAAILVAVISVNTAYTVLIPLVPQIERHAGLTESGISLVFAIYAGAKAVAQPLGGLWADRWPVSR